MGCKRFLSGLYSFLSNEKRICKLLNITPKVTDKRKKEAENTEQALIVDSLITIDPNSTIYTPPTALMFDFKANTRVAISALFGVIFSNIQNNGVNEPGITATTVVNPLIFEKGMQKYNVKCNETKLASNLCLIVVSAMEPRNDFEISTEIFTLDLNTNLNKDGEILLTNYDVYLPGVSMSPLPLHCSDEEKKRFDQNVKDKILEACKAQNLKTPDNFSNIITIKGEDDNLFYNKNNSRFKTSNTNNSGSRSEASGMIIMPNSSSNTNSGISQITIDSERNSLNQDKGRNDKLRNNNNNETIATENNKYVENCRKERINLIPDKKKKDVVFLSTSTSSDSYGKQNASQKKNVTGKKTKDKRHQDNDPKNCDNNNNCCKNQATQQANGGANNVIILPRRIEIVEHKVQINEYFYRVKKIFGSEENQDLQLQEVNSNIKSPQNLSKSNNNNLSEAKDCSMSSATLSIFSNLTTKDKINRTGQTCAICLGGEANVVAIPCRHLAFCMHCANDYRIRSTICPVCRSKIEVLISIYGSDDTTSDCCESVAPSD